MVLFAIQIKRGAHAGTLLIPVDGKSSDKAHFRSDYG